MRKTKYVDSKRNQKVAKELLRTDVYRSDASVGTALISHARHCRSRNLWRPSLVLSLPLTARHASSAAALRRSISAVMTRACCARRAALACRPVPVLVPVPVPAPAEPELAPNVMDAHVAISAVHTSRYPNSVRTSAASDVITVDDDDDDDDDDDTATAGTSNE